MTADNIKIVKAKVDGKWMDTLKIYLKRPKAGVNNFPKKSVTDKTLALSPTYD